MIGNVVKQYLVENEDNFLIHADKVAHVMDTNPLTHALLVLSKVRYSRIPVLNHADELVGFIGLANIVDAMFDLAEIDPDNLNGQVVSDVMDTDVTVIHLPFDVEKIFHLAVDHPFLSVADESNKFLGIVTRKELLKTINYLIHNIENDYSLEQKRIEPRKIS